MIIFDCPNCDPTNRFGQLGDGLGDQFDLLGGHLDNLGQGLNRCFIDICSSSIGKIFHVLLNSYPLSPSFALQPDRADGKDKPWGAPGLTGRGAEQVIC